MICLSFLSIFVHSDDYWKTICICEEGKCANSASKCDGNPIIDSSSSTFMEDFNFARKNIKNINVYFNAQKPFSVVFDMRSIAGLTLNFSSYHEYIAVIFEYVNNENYGGNYFNFNDEYVFPIFSPFPDTKSENSLKIGGINIWQNKAYFYKNNGKNTKIIFDSMKISTSSLTNISEYRRINSGKLYFVIDKYDHLTAKFSKSSSFLMVNSTEFPIEFKQGDTFGVEGFYREDNRYGDTLTIIIEDGITKNEIPALELAYISKIEIIGKLWVPSEADKGLIILKVGDITIPPGDFPFSILSESVNTRFSGDTVIYGNIDADDFSYSSSKMSLTTESTYKVNITFKGYVDSEISVQSPYLNLYIDNFTFNKTYSSETDFPIGFSFNKDACSYVSIKSISFRKSSITATSVFDSFPTIKTVYSDDELDNKLGKGFIFIDLPAKSLNSLQFAQKVNSFSPSALNSIPGFMNAGNCMSIGEVDAKDRIKLKVFKFKTAFSLPAYICITDGISKCEKPSGFSENPYIDVTSLPDGDISKYVNAGFKEIYITSTVIDSVVKINFNTLKGSDYIINLEGKLSNDKTTEFILIAEKGKIKRLTIFKAKIIESFAFSMPVVKLIRASFVNSKSYSVDANSNFTSDILSLDGLFKTATPPTFNEINLINDRSTLGTYSYWKEWIDVNSNIYKICMKGYDFASKKLNNDHSASLNGIDHGYYQVTVCAEHIDPKYFSKLNYESKDRLEFTINSMSTDIKPINIIANPVKKLWGPTYSITLNGKGWDTILKNKFTVDNRDNFMKVLVSNPGQADNIEVIGTAPVLFQVDYSNSQDYCVYVEGAEKSCYSSNPIDTIQIKSDDLATFVPQIINNSIAIKLDNSEKPHQLPMSLFDSKEVILVVQYGSKEFTKVELGLDGTKLNKIYSLTSLNNIQTVYTKDKDATAYFGQLIIHSWEADEGWKKHVSMEASQVVCRYEHLSQCKRFTITDQLNITGSLPTEGEEIIVEFMQDNNANDLVADIGGNVTIIINPGSITVGKINFLIKPSDNYDAYFQVKKHSKIIIQNNSTQNDGFTKFIIDCSYYKVDFEFKGKFPVPSGEEQSYIKIIGSDEINITTESSLPISIYGFQDTEFHLMNKDITTITGPLSYAKAYDMSSYGRIRFYSHVNEATHLMIPHGYIINSMEYKGEGNLTGIMSANIKLEIGKVVVEDDKVTGSLSFINTIDKNGASSITFTNPLPEKLRFGNVTYVNTQVFGKIEDESSFPFIKKPETIIKARKEDLSPHVFSFKYIVLGKECLTHGFYPSVNCLGINQTQEASHSLIRLSSVVLPSQIPFIIDYVDSDAKTDGELIINDKNLEVLDDLKDLLPKVFVGIVLRLYRNMDESHILNLDNIIQNRDSMSVEVLTKGKNPLKAYMTLPSNKALSFKCKNVKLGFRISDSTNFLAKNVSFIDCEFSNAEKFKFSNDIKEINMDVDSFNELVDGGSLSSYTGKMIVNSANVIMFTKDGWEFREDRRKSTVPIAASMFKNIQFQTSLQCMLVIEDETLDSIHSFKFDSFPDDQGTVFFELSRHWGKIKNLNGFKVNVNGATSVNLNTASYPIPKLFDIEDSDISYTLETDVYNQFDTITLENNRLFKDEDLNMNFQFLPSEFQYVNGDKVFFEGSSNINFVNDVGTLRLNESVFSPRSNTTLTKLETLKLMTVERTAEVTGTFKFSLSSTLQLHWTLTETTMLNHKSFEKGSPQWLELIYDESTADRDLYNSKMLKKSGLILMKGNFECFNMKRNIKFGGSYLPFGEGNTHLNVACDSSADGQVLLLQGQKEITDADESSVDSRTGNGTKIQTGGIAGIIIACAVAVGIFAAGVVYYIQRKKIDRLKNEIPVENTDAYRSNSIETSKTGQSSNDYQVKVTEEQFDDI